MTTSPVDTPRPAPGSPRAEPLIFEVAVEGVLYAFRSRFTPALENELRALGLDPDALEPGYPRCTSGRVRCG